MIESKDISVVMQGPIFVENAITQRACESVRKMLPNAEVILSTWKNENTKDIDYDVLVESEDPGPLVCRFQESGDIPQKNNINRQIVSSRAGIAKASRRYVMKLRTESLITSAGFLGYINRLMKEDDLRIMCFEPRNPVDLFEGTFCFCDFWFFGTHEQMCKMWDLPLAVAENAIGKFDYIPEEYLFHQWYKVCQTDKKLDYGCYMEVLKKRLIIIPFQKSGIISVKYPRLNNFKEVYISHNRISHFDWRRLQGEKSPSVYFVCLFSLVSGGIWRFFRRVRRRIISNE